MEDGFGLWELMVSTFWFMLLMCWIWLLVAMLTDILRDGSLRGAAKAGWVLLIVFVPWLGAITYLLVRGDALNARAHGAVREIQDARSTGSSTVSDQLRGLQDLRDRGVLSPAEYDQAKAKVLA